MLDGRGQVKLTDFGLASLVEGVDQGDLRAGTPAYQAPEQLRGEAGACQIEGARVGMAQNLGGSGATAVTHILRVS